MVSGPEYSLVWLEPFSVTVAVSSHSPRSPEYPMTCSDWASAAVARRPSARTRPGAIGTIDAFTARSGSVASNSVLLQERACVGNLGPRLVGSFRNRHHLPVI